MGNRDKFIFNDIVMNKLYHQRQSGKYCDIRLCLGDQFVWGHSSVMCSISPFIDEQCCNEKDAKTGCYKDFSLNDPVSIELYKKNVFDCFDCLQLLVDIVYGQNVEYDQTHHAHLYNLCKLLNISDLLIQFICNRRIKQEETKAEEHIENESKQKLKKLRLRTRLVKKMQSCLECSFKCYKPLELLKHLKETSHGSGACSLCFDRFDSVDELKEHYASHDDPKPFLCSICDSRFQTRWLLNQHLPRHSKETPYRCTLCKKGFKWKHGLNSHLLIHSNEKKHLCDECGFSTMHAKTLRAHKLIHTGDLFKCTFPGCTHSCSRKENMKIHLFTHSNDRPFVCEICGQKFTLNKSLKRHALIHSASGLNRCPHCSFKALRPDNLKAHILRQHHDKLETNCSVLEMMIHENDLCILADAASSQAKLDP